MGKFPFLSKFICLLCLCGAAIETRGAVEFSADVQEYTSEGIIYRRLTFKDDKQTISYLPPQGWNCILIGKNLHLRPTEKNFAAAQIEAMQLATPMQLDATATETLTERAMSSAPPGSDQVTVIKRELNSVLLNNHETFEVLISYKLPGEVFLQSVLFVNTPVEQIVFKVTARKSDFEPLYRAFRGSIMTWEWQPGISTTAIPSS